MKRLIVLLLALGVNCVLASESPAGSYPKDFIWGVAFSAHQTEGAYDGGENGDWYAFEHKRKWNGKPTIAQGHTADVATDFWHRYPEDLEHARQLGVDTVRTSLAWEKIEPLPGVFSIKVIQHYRAIFQNMRERGLRPMIAFHHFTHPRWFHEKGGWTHPESPKMFLRYAEYVVEELGDLCDLWVTFNEPVVLANFGYMNGTFPPNKIGVKKGFEAAWNLARAHRMVAAMIHRKQGQSPDARGADGKLRGVGLAQSTQQYDPFDPKNKNDVEAASAFEEMASWAFIRAIETGRLTLVLPKGSIFGDFDRELPSDDIADPAPGPFQDWIGINYYNRFLVKHTRFDVLGMKWIMSPEDEISDNGWAIHPAGLEKVLRKAAQFGRPLIVSENGLADASDLKRQRFLKNHLAMLDRAVLGSELGPALDIRGYYHWSLTDNFEWLHGYTHRFGLIEIDFENGLKRIPRPSAELYTGEIRKRSE